MSEEQPVKLTLKEQNVKHQLAHRERMKEKDIDKYREARRLEMRAYREKRKKIEEEQQAQQAKTTKRVGDTILDDYIAKIKTIHGIILQSELNTEAEAELTKLLLNKKFKKTTIKKALPYLKDINATCTKLRETYKKNTILKSHINVLMVILKELPVYSNQLNELTKFNEELSKKK